MIIKSTSLSPSKSRVATAILLRSKPLICPFKIIVLKKN